jgi:hypothetical protein
MTDFRVTHKKKLRRLYQGRHNCAVVLTLLSVKKIKLYLLFWLENTKIKILQDRSKVSQKLFKLYFYKTLAISMSVQL